MLPHMLFADDVPDVGSTRIWQSQRNPLAPHDIETSCITQPPVTAIADVAGRAGARARRLGPRSSARCSRSSSPCTSGCTASATLTVRVGDPDPPLGVRARHHPAVDAGDGAHAGAMVGTGGDPLPSRPRRSVPPAGHEVHPVGPAPDRRRGPCACSCSRELAEATRLRAARMPRDRSVLIQDLAFNRSSVAANRSLTRSPLKSTTRCRRHCSDHIARTTVRDRRALGRRHRRVLLARRHERRAHAHSTIATFLPLFAGVP